MGTSQAATQRLNAAPNAARGGLYVSRSAPRRPVPASRLPADDTPAFPAPAFPAPAARVEDRVRMLRDLARSGRLAEVAAAAGETERTQLTGAAFEVVWPIVFSRLTRRFELARGHGACASGVGRLADECLDRFHEDVEAVVEDLLAHARQPVLHLEAWIAGRLTAATVDHHRRMRGQRGALQRPRLPRWVAQGLHDDPWLTTLATEILVWVGVSATAGSQVWPLEAWAQLRGTRTGQWASSDAAAVARDVEAVLAVMRGRPAWFESYVERPLGAKPAPVASAAVGDGTGEIAVPLGPAEPGARLDTELLDLAAEAVRVIDRRVARGEQARVIAVDVIRAVFGGGGVAALDQAPYTGADLVGGLSGALADTRRVDRIVTTVLSIIETGQPGR